MWKVLAGAVSVACCLLVAWSLGGAPSWAGYLLPVAVAILLVAAVGSALREEVPSRRRARTRRREFASLLEPGPFSRERGGADQLTLDPVFDAVSATRTIDWLRTETFRTAWPDLETDPLRDLLETADRDSLLNGVFSHPLVQPFIDATRDFLAYYDRHTVSDPLLSGSDWREVRGRTEVSPEPSEAEVADDEIAQLRVRAVRVVNSYDLLAASGMQPARPPRARRATR